MLAHLIRVLSVVACTIAIAQLAVAQQAIDELLPSQARSLRAAIAESVYRIGPAAGGAFDAPNPAQGMRSRFTGVGVEVTGEDWTLGLSLEAWGRKSLLSPVSNAKRVVDGRRIEYLRDGITEWYVNDERGLEQGFMIEGEPAGEGVLRLEFVVVGGLATKVSPCKRDARFVTREGDTMLRYSGLRAWDATGRDLEASLWASGARFSIEVDDSAAVYPVYIDPLFWNVLANLVPTDGEIDFGFSVSISGDTAVVGSSKADAAYLFERNQGGPGAWGEVAKLVASDAVGAGRFGLAVAVSGDTAVVGAFMDVHATGIPGGPSGEGAAYVFERNHGGIGAWGESAKLTASDAASRDLFGIAVATSADTVVVGASRDVHAVGMPGTLGGEGAAYVFERDQGGVGSWGETNKLIASDAGPGDGFGQSVAVSGDSAVVGYGAYLFERDQGGTGAWGEVTKFAIGAGVLSEFGWSTAIAGDTALVSAYREHLGYQVDQVEGLAFDPTTNTLFGTGGSKGPIDQLLVIDRATGAASRVGSLGPFSAFGLAYDPGTGTLFGSDPYVDQLITIDTATGVASPVGALGFSSVQGLAFDPTTNTLYGVDGSSLLLITIDPGTGAGTAVGAIGFNTGGLAFDPGTNTLYGIEFQDRLIAIDTATGAGTIVGSLGSYHTSVDAVAFDPGPGTLYGADPKADSLLTVDTVTGSGSAVGALFPNALLGAGAVYVFERDLGGAGAWQNSVKLIASNPSSWAEFGFSVSLSGDTAVVGAPMAAGGGSAYVFDRDQNGAGVWGEVEILDAQHVTGNAGFFAYGVGVAGTTTVVGTWWQPPYSGPIGSAHAFGTVEFQNYCTPGKSFKNCEARISAVGTASSTAGSGFFLRAYGVEGQRDGMFFYGTNGQQMTPWSNFTHPNKRSYLCLIPPLQRGGLLLGAGTSGSCDGSFFQDLHVYWSQNPGKNPGPGAVVQAQLWYLDPQAKVGKKSSLSDAIEFPVGP